MSAASTSTPSDDRHYDFDEVDPKLRESARMIRSLPIEDRLLQIEAEADFFLNAKPIDS